jgi:hypothetical protein
VAVLQEGRAVAARLATSMAASKLGLLCPMQPCVIKCRVIDSTGRQVCQSRRSTATTLPMMVALSPGIGS